MSYNGWTNWETWNIAMWIGNDEMLNRIMTQAAKGNWETFKELAANWGIIKTPDGVYFEAAEVDQNQLYDAFLEDEKEKDAEEEVAELFPGTRDALNNLTIRQEDIEEEEEEEEECSVLEGRRLLRTRSFYI